MDSDDDSVIANCGPSYSRERRKPRIDIKTIQDWIGVCRRDHGFLCNERYSEALSSRVVDLILVDVNAGCLVVRPSSTPFAALSYVWGQVESIQTLSTNRERLEKSGALFEDSGGATLPRTIRDAMHLVKTLGDNYLWVDRLCLPQDSPKEVMDNMLMSMARIYTSAEYTIVAAEGSDANHGLKGVGGPSEDRDVNSTRWTKEINSTFPFSSVWAKRGWTFQESLFSRRLLIFDKQVIWLCSRCSWHETWEDWKRTMDKKVKRPPTHTPMGIMSLLGRVPDLLRWAELLENFSRRELTRDEDSEKAFAGATDVMGPIFPGGLFHGLPVFYFDIALLWEGGRSRRPGKPSWSWVGWTGAINCSKPWRPFYSDPLPTSLWDPVLRPAPYSSLKRVAYFRFMSSGDLPEKGSTGRERSDKRLSQVGKRSPPTMGFNGFYEYQALRKTPQASLPAGWERQSHPGGDYYTLRNDSMRPISYAYPLPLAEETPQNPLAGSSVLLCTTLVARISSRLRAPGIRPLSIYYSQNDVEVTNSESNERVHVDEKPGLPRSLTYAGNTLYIDDLVVGTLICGREERNQISPGCQLIVLSEGKVDSFVDPTMFSWPHPGSGGRSRGDYFNATRKGKEICFYNVMLIEWENDVAYRKGIGAVEKTALCSVGAECKTFKLG